MDNFEEIKQLWTSADATTLPKANDVVQMVKRYRLKQMLKTIGLIMLIILLVITMCWVVFVYHSQFLSTRIGEAFILIAIFILLTVHVGSLKRISASKSFSNTDFLLFLKSEQIRLMRYEQMTQKVGFAFASLGLFLYIFEAVHQQFLIMIISYAGVAIWCCISWFIIRPIAFKRKTNQLNETIARIEQFSEQLQNKSN